MSFLRSLFGNKPKEDKPTVAFLQGPDTFAVDIVGESNYQKNLETICGQRKKSGEKKYVTATITLENDNPADNQAVRIDIDNLTVGYFSRDLARQFRKVLKNTAIRSETIQCNALIVGGWQRGNDLGHYGVKLDLPIN